MTEKREPTLTMIRAVRAIAKDRLDYKYMDFYGASNLSFEQAKEYIGKYGRKIHAKG